MQEFKTSVRFQLEHARRMTQNLVEQFKSRDQWLFQPHPDANNAIWIVAHLGLADNYMMSKIQPDGDVKPDSLHPRYWFGSTPSAAEQDNASTQQVLDYFADRRRHLLRVFDQITPQRWNEQPTDGPFSSFPTLGHIFLFNTMHEAIHFGQLTVCHRALGNPPLRQPD